MKFSAAKVNSRTCLLIFINFRKCLCLLNDFLCRTIVIVMQVVFLSVMSISATEKLFFTQKIECAKIE